MPFPCGLGVVSGKGLYPHQLRMSPVPQESAAELPVDCLGLIVLKDLLASKAWNEQNYVLEASNTQAPQARANERVCQSRRGRTTSDREER